MSFKLQTASNLKINVFFTVRESPSQVGFVRGKTRSRNLTPEHLYSTLIGLILSNDVKNLKYISIVIQDSFNQDPDTHLHPVFLRTKIGILKVPKCEILISWILMIFLS
jgi:hypothetical protein